MRRARTLAVFAALALSACARSAASGTAPLTLQGSVPMPGVSGRIDHLALDPARRKLYVAALGSGAVEIVDLAAGKAGGRLGGLKAPQGLATLPSGALAVATGGDGAVRLYRPPATQPAASVALGRDADNVRTGSGGRLVVGYGGGALAIIDPSDLKVLSIIGLPAHPESFQLAGARAYVNLPDAGGIGVVDLETGKLSALWPNRGRRWNFPMAIDDRTGEILVVYRLPARLVSVDPRSGAETQALPTCGDADDLFVDQARQRIYVSCGDGHVDVVGRRSGAWARVGLVATAPGARTSLFDPVGDRLYVAAPARPGRSAAILVFRPE